MRVAVIGAGPSGLVTLKYLKTAHQFFPGMKPIEAMLFEAESDVGGTFTQRTYEDAELVSSRFLTSFSDFRPHDNDPDFLSTDRYAQYLRDYTNHFDLWESINLNSPVIEVRRRPSGGHVVHYHQGGRDLSYECDALAVCTGLHVLPNLPALPGTEHVPVVKHSAEFKERAEFGTNGTVVILGSGETGIDIAHLAVTSPTKRVVLCHRDGFLGAPKKIPNPVFLPGLRRRTDPSSAYEELPVDVSWQAPLFDSMYLHPLIRDTLFTWNVCDVGIKFSNWLVSGTVAGVDQWIGGVGPARYHASKLFFNKGAPKALPYISAPYRPTHPGLVERVRRALIQLPIEPIPAGRTIDLAPWPSHIAADGTMHFTDNGRPEVARMKALGPVHPDVLIFATGYRQEFPFFRAGDGYPAAGDADVRSVFRRADPSIAFVGFVRPGYGAIPPLSELQAQLWVLALLRPAEVLPRLRDEDDHHFRLHGKGRVTYGVDHETYAYQLALDIGAAPSLWEMFSAGWRAKGTNPGLWWRLPVIWAAGAQFNTKFRVRGPWAWDGAPGVLGGELWQTISRRHGLFNNFVLAVMPITVLGIFSLFLWIVGLLLGAVNLVCLPFTYPFRRRKGPATYKKLDGLAYTDIEGNMKV